MEAENKEQKEEERCREGETEANIEAEVGGWGYRNTERESDSQTGREAALGEQQGILWGYENYTANAPDETKANHNIHRLKDLLLIEWFFYSLSTYPKDKK